MSWVLAFSPRGHCAHLPTPWIYQTHDPQETSHSQTLGIQFNIGRAKGCGDGETWLLRYAATRESCVIGGVSGKSYTWEIPAPSSCSRPLGFLQEGADTFVSQDVELQWATSEEEGKTEQEEVLLQVQSRGTDRK